MYRYLKQHKLLLAVSVALLVISGLTTVLIALVLQRVLDTAIAGNMEQFTQSVLFSVGYFILVGVVAYLAMLAGTKLVYVTLKSLRRAVFAGIMKRNMEQFHAVNTADYLSALNNDIKLLETNCLDPMFEVIMNIVRLVTALAVMFYFDIIVSFVVIGASLLMFLVPSLLGAAMQKRQEEYSQTMATFMLRLKDFLSGFEILKTYRMGKYAKEEFEEKNKEMFSAEYRVGKLTAANGGLSLVLSILVQIAAICVAAFFITTGRITPGILLGLIIASGNLVGPIAAIFQHVPMIKGSKPIIERMIEFADHENTGFTGTKAPTFQKNITVSNVQFGYNPGEVVLQDVSVTFERGQKYVIIGGSGCGKTTLIKLLAGYYSGFEGEITYDGVDLQELDIELASEMSAMIHQNIYLFDETIGDNICLHKTYSDKELQRALSISGVDLFLDMDAKDLSTPVGENGANLSGGQRQRIAVARALIQEKPILILDEGTSAIDMQTAYDIESRLLAMDELTLITITHALNPELLQAYDQIIFMEHGKISETGTYAELMQNNGTFAQYCNIT